MSEGGGTISAESFDLGTYPESVPYPGEGETEQGGPVAAPTSLEEQKARQELAILEKEWGELSESARAMIEAIYGAKGRRTKIDERTEGILEQYCDISQSKKIKKFFAKLGAAAGLGVAGGALRAIIYGGGLHFGAGAIVGGVMGAAVGGFRARAETIKQRYGPEGLRQEYEAIKSSPSPTAKEDALSFLENALTLKRPNKKMPWTPITQHLQVEQVQKEGYLFRGDYKDLLELLAFYRQELYQTVLDRSLEEGREQPVAEIPFFERQALAGPEIRASGLRLKLDDGQIGDFLQRLDPAQGAALVNQYENDPNFKREMKASIWKGVARGALIGAGFGLVSDFLASYIQYIRHHEAYHQFLEGRTGEPGVIPMTHSAPRELLSPNISELSHGLNRTTDFGYELSRAVEQGVNSGQLHLPPGMTDTQYHDFLHALRFAPVTNPAHDYIPLGTGKMYFHSNGLAQLLHQSLNVDGKINFGTIQGADSLVSKAINNAASVFANKEAAGFLAQAGYGALAVAPAAVTAGKMAIGEYPRAGVEAPPLTAPDIRDWKAELSKGPAEFMGLANYVMSQLFEKGWGGMRATEQRNLSDLLTFLVGEARNPFTVLNIKCVGIEGFTTVAGWNPHTKILTLSSQTPAAKGAEVAYQPVNIGVIQGGLPKTFTFDISLKQRHIPQRGGRYGAY